MLSCGIVGLPNSGKSTLFNTLLGKQVANVADYPFTTIEPNVGVVEVPDERLKKITGMIRPEKAVPAAVKFIDIAGLVKNAHQGEGLGNQFLAKIRECDAIIHLLRGFKDSSVAHYYGSIDFKRDQEIVDLELELGEIKKPTLYVVNDGDLGKVKEDWLVISAKNGKGVDQLIKKAYELLGLITFYTVVGGREVRAWALKEGSSALAAAAKVHTDMAQGFIKAEVVSYQDLEAAAGWQKARSGGKIRLEGRDYPVRDGDVIEFKFHV